MFLIGAYLIPVYAHREGICVVFIPHPKRVYSWSALLFDTAINMVTLASYFNNINSINAAPSNLATNNTVKSIKGSDIGNNRCIKYFTPTQGVLAKLTINWLKYDGTPYDFQGQDHAIHLEILTVKQTGTYFS